ncbi:MAG: hypothetical protein CFH35_01114 [Alphaproteobacteria bacterium MarineAlpha9_Bin5]|nr:MAG: hypothetical protein CFH35_01114 [Alphaproteobacteria bacterium MarineAlpha9_Bin5]
MMETKSIGILSKNVQAFFRRLLTNENLIDRAVNET